MLDKREKKQYNVLNKQKKKKAKRGEKQCGFQKRS